MAKVYITEYDGNVVSALQAPREPRVAEQTLAIGGTSVQSNAFNTVTKLIQISGDAVFSMEIGESPVATANTARVPADTIIFKVVQAGHKLAVITNT